MPNTGLLGVYGAKYTYDDATDSISYSEGFVLGEAVAVTASVESSDAENFYSNDSISETSPRIFNGGDLTLTTNHLTDEASKAILNLTEKTLTSGDSEPITYLSYGSDDKSSEFGIGVIVTGQIHNVPKYQARIYDRVVFSAPEESYETRGESVSWQTPELPAKIMRAHNGEWKASKTCDTIDEADAFLRAFLSIPDNVKIIIRSSN